MRYFKNSLSLFFVVVLASQFPDASAQSPAKNLNNLLQSYYSVKDALVAGKSDSAAIGAASFIRNLNGISYQLISEGNVTALEKDASAIERSKDISTQRKYFSNLSSNMAEVAKALDLSGSPVYIQYCPMKKAYWLSDNQAIRNPYYGSAMLTCGEVKKTL